MSLSFFSLFSHISKHKKNKRGRLEYYEQACAVDSVTKKCAGRASSCRSAMLGILGTPLRTSCACQGTDVQQLYGCMGWHRLLWLNPCVGKWIDYIWIKFLFLMFVPPQFISSTVTVESQKDFHMKRLAELGLLLTTTTTTSTTTTTTAAPVVTKPIFIGIARPTRLTRVRNYFFVQWV